MGPDAGPSSTFVAFPPDYDLDSTQSEGMPAITKMMKGHYFELCSTYSEEGE
jgi:hypothetical protein